MSKFELLANLALLPRPATAKWPGGIYDVDVFRSGAVSASLFAPRGEDHQTPHDRDEFYVVVAGSGTIDIAGERVDFAPGDLLHVSAGVPHRFLPPLTVTAWVIFFEAADAPSGA